MANEIVVVSARLSPFSNATITSSGSVLYSGISSQQVTLLINVTGSITGTSPTLQFTIAEVDPQNGTTVIGNSASSTVINAAGSQTVILPTVTSDSILVSWTIGGSSSPTFNGVDVSVVGKNSVTSILYDMSGAPLGTSGNPIRTNPTGGTIQPVSGTVTANQGAAPWSENITQFGGVNISTGTGASGTGIPRVTVSNDSNILATQSGTWTVAQGTANTLANKWPVQVTDGTNTMPTADTVARALFEKITDGTNTVAVKAASTAAAAADPSLVTAFSPNSALPTGANTIGIVNQGTAATLANAWSTKITDTTNGPVAVKAASTVPVAADLALVVSLSPNDALTGTSSRRVQGTAAAGAAPVGNPVLLGGVQPSGNMIDLVAGGEGGLGVDLMANEFIVQTNATVTTSSSQTITKNFYGVQQINLIVNVSGSVTGTLPTLTYTIQEIDPGNGTTTMGNSASTAVISATGVYTASLNTTTSCAVKVTWTIGGSASPTFNGVYATVVGKVTPSTQTVSTTSTSSTPGISLGYVVTTSKTNVAVQASTYNEQSANFTGSIKSSSANDTSAGTGARTVTIYYVDSTGATAGTENATLNGTTAVNLVTATKCFIEKIVVNTAGSVGSNVGTITLNAGAAGAGTAVAVINIGDNQTYLGHHYVVTGKTCHVTDYTGTTSSTNQTLFTIQSIVIPMANEPSVQVSDWINGAQTFQMQRTFSSPVAVPGPARLQLFGAPGATASITSYASFTFYDQ